MSAGSSPVPIEALLAHQGFVRALARRLVRDPHAAEDVAQETWIEAARSQTAPRSLRGWLAEIVRTRASNRRRADMRRVSREHTAARAESVESHDVVERVELESRVVRAVLALREPYRSVVLGRYYENASTAELARRQGVTESSVRSQESRGLELLRRELDTAFDGGRAAWSAFLAPLAVQEPLVKLPLALSAGIVVALAIAAVARWMPEHDGEAGFAATARSVGVAREDSPRQPSAAPSIEQVPADPAPANTFGPSTVELEALDVSGLLRLALQLRAALRERLLTPDPALVAPYAAPIARGELHAVRILRGEIFGRTYGGYERFDMLGVRGGGAAYSFGDDLHDDIGGDVWFRDGKFRSSQGGELADLGDIDIEAVPRVSDALLAGWDDKQRALWRVFWRRAYLSRSSKDPEFQRDLAAARGHSAVVDALDGHTYLLRVLSPGLRDALFVFRSLGADGHGRTLVWRKLAEWPLEERVNVAAVPQTVSMELLLGAPPAWLEPASPAQLIALLERVRAIATPRVLAVPAAIRERFEPLFQAQRGGVVKLVPGGELDVLVIDGDRFDCRPLPADQRSRATARTAPRVTWFRDTWALGGDTAWSVDLGVMPLATVDLPENVPSTLGTWQRDAWDFVWRTLPATTSERQGQSFTQETGRRAQKLELNASILPRVGHTYLARMVWQGEFDLTIALEVVAADAYGLIVAWRVLRELDAPGKPR